MSTTVWSYLADELYVLGCSTVIGLPPDEPGLLDAAEKHSGLTAIGVRDQRTGACLATGYALTCGRPVALEVSSGPSLLNALTGISEASSVGVPLIVISVRIAVAGIGRGGFQDIDQLALVRPLVGWSYRVEDIAQLSWAIRKAVTWSMTGRPSVAFVELAHEIITDDVSNYSRTQSSPLLPLSTVPATNNLLAAIEVMSSAERPLIVIGGGCRRSTVWTAIEALADTWGAAVASTAAGRSATDERYAMACGLVGLYATPPFNEIFDAADVVFGVATRWEETATMGWPGLSTAKVISIDRDVSAFGESVEVDCPLLGDAGHTIRRLSELLQGKPLSTDPAWAGRVRTAQAQAERECQNAIELNLTASAIRAISDLLVDGFILAQDNGLHDMWTYHFPLSRLGADCTAVMPGEQTFMGFGLAAAVGAALADPSKVVVSFCGDGAAGMSWDALATAAEHGCGLLLVVLDDGGFGWPRRLRLLGDDSDMLTRFGMPVPVEALVQAFDGRAVTVCDRRGLSAFLDWAVPSVRQGKIAAMRIPVGDDDIPLGVRRVFG